MSFLLVLFSILVFGQEIDSKIKTDKTIQRTPAIKPLFIFEADDKTVQVENKANESILNDVDVDQIETLEVLKEGNVIAKYGDAARNGVIIIHFRDYKSLNFRTKKLFDEAIPVKSEPIKKED